MDLVSKKKTGKKQTKPVPPPSVLLPNPFAKATASATTEKEKELTKTEHINKYPELKEFYDKYDKLPLAPTEGEGSHYKTPEDFGKLTSSHIVPPKKDLAAERISDKDKTQVEVSKASLAEQYKKTKLTKEEKAQRKEKIKKGEIILGPDSGIKAQIKEIIADKFKSILESAAASLLGMNVKELYDGAKEVKDSDGADRFFNVVDLSFTAAENWVSLIGKIEELFSALSGLSEAIHIPVISSVLDIAKGIWDMIKDFREIRQIAKRMKFLKEKQNNHKQKRFEKIMAKRGPVPEEDKKAHKDAAKFDAGASMELVKSRQKEDLKKAEAQRKKDREIRKQEREKVLEERLKTAKTFWERRQIKKEMEEERKALRKMREADRDAAKEQNKQEIKNLSMYSFAIDHEDESDLKRSKYIFGIKKGDGSKAEDYKINKDKVRSDVFYSRSKGSISAQEQEKLNEDEEVIANYRAKKVLKTKLRGKVLDVISGGMSLVGEGIEAVITIAGVPIPVGTALDTLGTVMTTSNTAFNTLREFFGNRDDTIEGKRYLDRSSEINTILRKTDQVKSLDATLADDATGSNVDDFGQKYKETKKYITAYGIDMKEAVSEENPTKYHVVKHMMEAVSKV